VDAGSLLLAANAVSTLTGVGGEFAACVHEAEMSTEQAKITRPMCFDIEGFMTI
jgi:hypothetical protein